MSTTGLAFFHGWGLHADFWTPLRRELSHWPHAIWDAGYTGAARTPDWSAADRWVLVGHSRGWAHALRSQTPRACGSVSVCGFTHFCATQPDEAGQAPRVMDRMLRAWALSPEVVLHDFLHRADLLDCAAEASCPLNLAALEQDLRDLRQVDLRAAPCITAHPILALASQDDPIVSPELSQNCFADLPQAQLRWHANGGHALGWRHAAWCAQEISAFLKGLDG